MTIEFMADASSTVYAIERSHIRIEGTIALPTYANPPRANPSLPNGSTPGNPATPARCRIVRLHAPIEMETVKWTAVKEGAPPFCPNPYKLSPNLQFKEGSRSGSIPIDLAGYTGHAWSMAGTYVYHMLEPTDLNSTMPLGITPYEQNIKIDDAIVPNVFFVNWLLEKLPPSFQDPIYVPAAG